MLLKFKGVGNPELQQYADVSTLRILEVGSFADGSRKTLEYIKEWNLGGGDLVAEIFDKHRNGSQVASVSYNGKVWEGKRIFTFLSAMILAPH